MPLGVVVERRRIENPWTDYSWSAVAVIPGAPEIDDWTTLRAGEDWVHFHAGTLPLELFPKETEGYRYNLSCDPPMVFVVLREGEEAEDHEIEPALVTVCPHEAQDYLDTGEDQVEAVHMPDAVRGWLASYVEQHHVDEPFKKRRQRDHKAETKNRKPNMPPGARSARGDAKDSRHD